MSNPLRAVLVGCGGMSHAWLSSAESIPDLEIVGLVDINEQSANNRKEEFKLSQAITGTDLTKVLETACPDIVFDCTVPEAHVNVTLEALRHGCHVLGEKPMADSMSNAWRMVHAAKRAEKLYAVIQNRRYDPRIRSFRDFLASGQIGRLTTVNCDFYLAPHFGGFRDQMQHVLLLDMAIHTFDAARMISGAEPVSVYCKEWNPPGSWYAHDASAIAVFEMTDGIVYTYRGSWCAEGINTTWECDWRVIGDKGTAKWDGGDGFKAQAVSTSEGFTSAMVDLSLPTINTSAPRGHEALIREFVECVRSGATPQTICTDNIKSLAMVFAAIESAETGRVVPINLGMEE